MATPVRDGGLGIPLDAFNFFANPLHLAVFKADLVLARWLLKQPGVRMRQRLRFFPFPCTELELAKIPLFGTVISGPQCKQMLEFLQTEAQEQRTLLQAMSSESFAGTLHRLSSWLRLRFLPSCTLPGVSAATCRDTFKQICHSLDGLPNPIEGCT